ncbi:MAG: hypothetical protein ABJA67_06000 [Chthonomonadales bacterium]
MSTITADRSVVESPGTGDPNLYSLKTLPDPQYDQHPAYGKCFPPPTLGTRVQALKKLLPWVGVVIFKRAMLMDRIPALPAYKGHIQGGIVGRVKALPRYVPYIFKAVGQNLAGLFKSQAPNIEPKDKEQVDSFLKTGFATSNLEPQELQHIQDLVAKPLDDLLEKRAAMQERTFVGNTRFFNSGDDAALFEAMNVYLEKHGMLAAASAYIGRPTKLTHLLIQVNDPKDSFYHGRFKDIGLPDQKTNYIHVDTSYDMVKCVVYLNEVGDENGPFSFILGSHKARPIGLDGVIRRAMDRSNLSNHSPELRKLFMALPKSFRRKFTFGADILDGTPESGALLEAEYFFKSSDGNMGLFANNGIHRGGLTKSGERRVLFGVIA